MQLIPIRGKTDTYIYSYETIIKSKGKFNDVFLGAKASDQSKVIIKKLNYNLKDNSNAVLRFKNEMLIDFEHPNIAQTFDYVHHDNDFYIIRQYIEGVDLKSLIKNQKKINKIFIIKCFLRILDGLIELHARKIIHCDIRPANIIIPFKPKTKEPDWEDPQAILIDFGLAVKMNENIYKTAEKVPFALIYSPPEQVLNFGKLVNPTSDLYSLGISLTEAITGKLPYLHVNPEAIINLQITQPLKKTSEMPQALFDIIKKATNKYIFPLPPNRYNKQQLEEFLKEGQLNRYFDAKEMQNDLKNLAENPAKLKISIFNRIFC